MEMQRILHALPAPLRRHKLIRALAFIDPGSCVQLIQFNQNARAFVDVREGNFRTVMISGAFDADYFRIAQAFLPEDGVYFDVGANAGLCSFGLVPARRRAQYHLFEANPQLWPLLRRSIALHGGVDLRLVDAAVGERAGTIQIQVDNDAHDIGQAFIRAGAGVETRMLTLDDYIRDNAIARADFVKMDIEGYECFALAGARAAVAEGRLPVIYFELKASLVARHGKSVRDVLEQFRAAGYAIYHVRDRPAPAGAPWPLEIAGLGAAPLDIDRYPDSFVTDLLAIHASATHLPIRQTSTQGL